MLGANGTTMIEAPASSPPPTMAGRRPTVSTNVPAGPTAIVWATAATANAIPVHDGGRSSTSTTRTGTSEDRMPCAVQPFARLVRQAAWKRVSRSTSRKAGRHVAARPVPPARPRRSSTRPTVPATTSVPA